MRIRNASKDTLLGRADCKLSDIASQLSQINRSLAESYEDARAFGALPEVGGLLRRNHERLRETLFREYDTTEDEALEAIKERTSEKWMHFHSNLI